MSEVGEGLGSRSAGFALSAAIVAVFNTALACAKDAYDPLNVFMNKMAGHNWTTQALCDVSLFLILGMVFSQMRFPQSFGRRLPAVLFTTALLASVALFSWYALY